MARSSLPGIQRVIESLPRGVVELARSARTAALWCAGPLDALARRAAGRPDLPPLWLRRHAGRIRDFESSNPGWLSIILHEAPPRPGSVLLDLGCGPGGLAATLRPHLPPDSRYVGFDVHAGSIAWCLKAFRGDARFSFELARVRSGFGAKGGAAVEEYRFPAADGSVDLVLAKSLFTHLLEPEMNRYLAEIARVLSPEGRSIISTFLFAGGAADESAVPAFRCPPGPSAIRWRVRSRPEAAIAYARPFFEEALKRTGLEARGEWLGFYPGDAPRPVAQDLLLLARVTPP